MRIVFNYASKKLLEFPSPVEDSDANLAVRLNEALEAATGSWRPTALFVIPVESVRYLQSFPAPKKLPANGRRRPLPSASRAPCSS